MDPHKNLASKHAPTLIRIATRQSKLALWQAEYVRQALLVHYPYLSIELSPMLTQGDRQQTATLIHSGGKALFVKELQNALLTKKADLAVHSIKDMSVHPTPGLTLATICKREDERDVFISLQAQTLAALPIGAKVGTTSPRRRSQLLALRPDLEVEALRGNIDTRLQRLISGDFCAILLAAAGLHRLNLNQHISEYLDPATFIPAIGQGAIGIECRVEDNELQTLISHLNHKPTALSVAAERAVNRHLGGDCMTPIGAYTYFDQQQNLTLTAMVGSLDGKHLFRASHQMAVLQILQAETLGQKVAEQLLSQGAAKFL